MPGDGTHTLGTQYGGLALVQRRGTPKTPKWDEWARLRLRQAIDGPLVVDVYVFYTTAAKNEEGGQIRWTARISRRSTPHLTFSNSNLTVRVRLAGSAETVGVVADKKSTSATPVFANRIR